MVTNFWIVGNRFILIGYLSFQERRKLERAEEEKRLAELRQVEEQKRRAEEVSSLTPSELWTKIPQWNFIKVRRSHRRIACRTFHLTGKNNGNRTTITVEPE